MSLATADAERILDAAVRAARGGSAGLAEALESLPAPIYVTDREGVITHYNRACIDFAGRTPAAGSDRWCVTWKLYTSDGEFLPHEDCPMAVAIRERREVRGARAVAERPDGIRRAFEPWPTPIYDESGELVGAVNMLVDVTSEEQAQELSAQARRCRRLADCVNDPQTVDTLNRMAAQYEQEAAALKRPN